MPESGLKFHDEIDISDGSENENIDIEEESNNVGNENENNEELNVDFLWASALCARNVASHVMVDNSKESMCGWTNCASG